jgi:ATPase subunit of ABC transporter with duplicated ATPase domains
LLQVDKLSLGYDGVPLFNDVSFSLHEGERIRLHGRNGAGKTTIVSAVMAKIHDQPLSSERFAGHIISENKVRLGHYEQEIDAKYLPLTLAQAIEQVFMDKDVPVGEQVVKQMLGNYLFDPVSDGAKLVKRLSGGQKARFQMIRMLANTPEILILDEPTNHLDLPSIEELENALVDYHGAILYISHDSYFADKLDGKTVNIGS